MLCTCGNTFHSHCADEVSSDALLLIPKRLWMQGQKLKQRIAFRNKLTPPREVHSIEGDDIVYELTAVVVHVGTTLAHGVAPSLTYHSHVP